MKKVLCFAFMGVFLSQCSWFKKKDIIPTDPIAQLPPETQTGANTFGCLVNGKVWTPEGKRSTFSNNYTIDVDPGLDGGILSIAVYRYSGQEHTELGFGIDSVTKYKENTYNLKCIQIAPFQPIRGGAASYTNYKINNYYICYENAKLLNAKVNLTRYDLTNRIISGTFEFTLAKPNDTIKVTNGRFDKKLN